MRTNKISCVQAKELNRHPGYLKDVKAHSETWDEKSGIYQMTDKNWAKMKKKWTPRRERQKQTKKTNSDKCPHATRTCCGQPDGCSLDGGDCPDPLNKECKKRLGV